MEKDPYEKHDLTNEKPKMRAALLADLNDWKSKMGQEKHWFLDLIFDVKMKD